MRHKHCFTWNIARKLKNVENETQKRFELKYGEKHLKTWTMRNEHCRAWIMARKLQIMENEKHTV